MKKFLTILLSLSVLFFISCGGEDTQDNTSCNNECKSWETCSAENTCELQANKCNENKDCSDTTKPICDTTKHECIADTTPECSTNSDCKDSDKPICDNGVCVADNTTIECIIGHEENGECTLSSSDIHDMGVTTGSAPNQILLHDGSLFIVNSMDNAIQKIDLTDGPTDHNPFISLPENSNPYFMTIDDNNELFVTNLMTNSYSRVMLNDETNVVNTVFEADNSLKAPEGIAVNNDNIFIANADYTMDENWVTTYNDGFITIVNKSDNSFVKKITTNQKNPQRVFILDDKLYVINSGVVEFDESYVAHPKSDSGIDILDLSNVDNGFTNVVIPFTEGKQSGFVGAYTLSNDKKDLYLASGTAPELYAYDIENNTMLRNTDNPIIVDTFENPTSVMLNLTTVENYIFVTNFNNDMLYVLDANNDYKVVIKADIGEDSESMEGAQGIAYDKTNKQVYIFFGISKKLIAIDVNL